MENHLQRKKKLKTIFITLALIMVARADIRSLTDVTTPGNLQINTVKCVDFDCLKCSTPIKCEVCKNGFFLESSSGQCKVCGVGCVSCYETGACHTCDTDYNLQGNGKCEYDSWGWLPWVLIIGVILIAFAGLYFLIKGHTKKRNVGRTNYFELDERNNNSRLYRYGGVPISQTNLSIDPPHHRIWERDTYSSSDEDYSYRKKRRLGRSRWNRKSRFLKSRAKRSRYVPLVRRRRKKKSYYDYMEDNSDDFDYSPPRYFYTPDRLKEKRLKHRVTPYNPYMSRVPPFSGTRLKNFATPMRSTVISAPSVISRQTRFSAPSVLINRRVNGMTPRMSVM